ncbi:MAG: DUF294 nucleotidyltransferase-like domain-containing protein, partial [Pseudomonadota bacterium]
IDALLDQDALADRLATREELDAYVAGALAEQTKYEQVLDRARVIAAEQSFLIGVRTLSHTIDAGQAGAAYSDLAEVLIDRLSQHAIAEFERQHGQVPGGAFVVLAMGKLGGREMTAASDLDLIVIYDADEDASGSSGTRPLATSQYYARFTQRLISALSAPTVEGALYDVDLRLRPSGQKGPVATRLSAFQSYQRDAAWTWEHMALTRARAVAGDAKLVRRVCDEIEAVLRRQRSKSQTFAAVRDMRELVYREKGSANIWDLKAVRGGLVDVEFIAQALQLVHAHEHAECLHQTTLDALTAFEAVDLLGNDGELLIQACDLYNQLTQVLRLCFDGPFVPDRAPDGLKQLIARTAELPTFEHVEAELARIQIGVVAAFDRLVPAAQADDA